ncbi:MAG: hypothetical protein ACYDBW_11740 [Sulfuricaulis sp.]
MKNKNLVLYFFAACALLLLFSHPFQPTWYDENYSLTNFVRWGPKHILSDYHVPNNHILYSLGLWGWREMFGTNLLTSRFFSLALTALAIPGLMLAGSALERKEIGILAAIIFSVSHVVGGFSAQLRGYGPSMGLLTLALGFAALWWRGNYCRWGAHGLPYGICGALAVGILPTNLIFAGVISAWTLLSGKPQNAREKGLALAIASLPLLGLIVYTGVWNQALYWTLHNHRFTTSYAEFLRGTVNGIFVYDQPWSLPIIVLGLILVRGTEHARWYRSLAGLAALTFLVPLVAHAPPARIYAPLVPIVSLLVAWSIWHAFMRYTFIASLREKFLLLVLCVVLATTLREVVLRRTAESRWMQAQGAPQTLTDQYYNSPEYNPQAVVNVLLADPALKIIFTAHNFYYDVLAPEPDIRRLGIKSICSMSGNTTECISSSENTSKIPEKTKMYIIHYDEKMVLQIMSHIPYFQNHPYQVVNLIEAPSYYKVWRIEEKE